MKYYGKIIDPKDLTTKEYLEANSSIVTVSSTGTSTNEVGYITVDDVEYRIKQGGVLNGYYLNGKFYTDSTYQTELEKTDTKVYVDKNTNRLFIYVDDSETGFLCINDTATSSKAGIMKLYGKSGQNTDGTITQKVITDGIDDITFAVDESDPECLVLSKPW